MAEPDRYELEWQLAMARGSERTRAALCWCRVGLVAVLLAAGLWLVTR